MLDKIIEKLNELDTVKYNCIYAKEVINEATEMFNNGWDYLPDNMVIQTKGDFVAVKKGNKIEKLQMKDFRIESGKLIGNIDKVIGEIEVTDDKKESFLSQAIVTRFYTVRTI